MYVARDGFYKIGDGNFHDQLIPNQPQKKSSIIWHWVLRGGSIYKMGSTKWCGPTPPTLKTRWISILFCARPHPFCRGNWRGDGIGRNYISIVIYPKNQPNVGKYTSPMDGMGWDLVPPFHDFREFPAESSLPGSRIPASISAMALRCALGNPRRRKKTGRNRICLGTLVGWGRKKTAFLKV